ncbi:MAG TPA: prolipoprotein diacylglyceryl transferase [Chitinispirillaceae bacterium]|nr:prolipoprotein diacylglyceryl transferase [Chitinispirillaceae bacterium]
MYPELFKIFSFPIHSYGMMLAISFLVGILISTKIAKQRNLNPDIVSDLAMWVILAAIAGARLYYVILHFEEFQGDLLSIVNPFQNGMIGIGGLVMLGGLLGAIAAGFIYFRVKKASFLPYADIIAPSVGIGIFFTRIGCFLNGCCYGAPATGWCSVHFPPISPAGHYQAQMHAAGLFPSQLYESIGGLLMAGVLFLLMRRKFFTGFHFYLMGLMYGILRFFVDYSRHYGEGEHLGPFSHNQVICILMFVIFLGLILKNILFKKPESIVSSSQPVQAAVNEPAATVEKK